MANKQFVSKALLEQLKIREDALSAAQLEAIQWTNNLAEIA